MADLSERMSRLRRILKEIGWGGTATVYRAARVDVVLVVVVVGLGGCRVATTPEAAQPTVTCEPTEFVPTNAPTATPTDTPTPTETPIPLGFSGHPVTRNNQWTPVIQEFEGVEMALVPAGCFMMGSEDGESDERPVHEVCFEEPYWIDVYEVTNAQFATFGGPTTYPSEWTDSDRPRERITWTEASAVCKRRWARLPTEAEWEYAARGPDGLVFPWGNTFVADNVVYGDNAPDGTAPVGSRPRGVSWVGAFDLSGNVWEWVNDWYSVGYYSTLADGVINPQGPPGPGRYRVLRGGSWESDGGNVRAANRRSLYYLYEFNSVGFRCADSYQP